MINIYFIHENVCGKKKYKKQESYMSVAIHLSAFLNNNVNTYYGYFFRKI